MPLQLPLPYYTRPIVLNTMRELHRKVSMSRKGRRKNSADNNDRGEGGYYTLERPSRNYDSFFPSLQNSDQSNYWRSSCSGIGDYYTSLQGPASLGFLPSSSSEEYMCNQNNYGGSSVNRDSMIWNGSSFGLEYNSSTLKRSRKNKNVLTDSRGGRMRAVSEINISRDRC